MQEPIHIHSIIDARCSNTTSLTRVSVAYAQAERGGSSQDFGGTLPH